MELVPFLYFTILSLWIYNRNKRKIDIAFIISCIYALSAFFGILLIRFNLVDVGSVYHGYETLEATAVYCCLLTVCLFPFIKYPFFKHVNARPIKDSLPLKVLAWVGAVWFLILLLFAFQNILSSLMDASSGKLTNINKGEDMFDVFSVMPVGLRIPMILLSYLFACSWIFIFLAFYSFAIQRLQKSYFYLFVLASLYSPMLGILGGDRSKMTYWLITVVVCYLFFKPYFQANTKVFLRKVIVFTGSLIILYLFITTESRFNDSFSYSTGMLSGSQNSLIAYLGQPYINFCYFYEEFSSGLMFLGILFPFTFSMFVPNSMVGGVNIQEFFTDSTGVFGGVFYTYLGQIMMAAGITVVVIFCIVYALSAYNIFGKMKTASLNNMFIYMAFASVMFLGLFVHFYTAPKTTFSLFFFLFFFKMITGKKI